MRRRALLLAGATAVLGAARCRRREAPPAPARDVIRIAHESDLFSLDPTAFAEATTHSVLSNIFEGLVAFDRDMALVPGLATQWNATDERTWMFELRPNVRFHDGTRLTAAEVLRALERARTHPQSAVRAHLATIASMDADGDQRVVLRTARRDSLLVNRLTYVLLARDVHASDGAFRPVGTGPYEFVRWDKGRKLEARAFGGYWGGRPPIPRAEFVPVPEGPAMLNTLRAGDVDALRYVPEAIADQARSIPGLRIVSRPGLTTYYLWFRALADGKPPSPFADRRVRQAVSLAIDRAEIVRRVGNGVPSNQFVEKGVFGYVAGLPPLAHDPARARALLADAGHAAGFDVVLTHRAGSSIETVVAAVREMLAAVGIRARLESPPWTSVVEAWTSARLPFFYAGWRFESGDAHSFFVDCLKTRDAARHEGTSNPGFSDPALDRLVDEHAEIFGEANRLRHYEQITRKALGEMPLVPVYTRDNVFAVSQQVAWEPRLDGRLLAAEMSFRSSAPPA